MSENHLREGVLIPKEIDLIDTYFSRHYLQGKLLEIPDECYTDGKNWADRNLIELGFLSPKRKPYGAIYNGQNHSIIDLVRYRPRINLREEARENGIGVFLEPHHLGFKFWLQERIELAAAGNGSPRMLQGMHGKLDEKDAATSKWEELSEKIREELEKDLLNEIKLAERTQKSDSKAPILALNIFNKVEVYKRKKEQDEFFGGGSYINLEKLDVERLTPSKPLPIESLCREIVYSLFSHVKPKIPSDEKILKRMTYAKLEGVFDELGMADEWGEATEYGNNKEEKLDFLLENIDF